MLLTPDDPAKYTIAFGTVNQASTDPETGCHRDAVVRRIIVEVSRFYGWVTGQQLFIVNASLYTSWYGRSSRSPALRLQPAAGFLRNVNLVER